MVKRNLGIPHDFICFTDSPVDGVKCLPPPCDLPGWWGKIGFFQPLDITYPVLYLDLDVIIINDITPLFNEEDFCTIKQWKKIKALKTIPGYNSSAMLFGHPGCREAVFDNFAPWVMQSFRGDQDWLKATYISECTWPADWFRAAEDCSREQPDCKVVLCNYMSNYAATKLYPWAKEAWQ